MEEEGIGQRDGPPTGLPWVCPNFLARPWASRGVTKRVHASITRRLVARALTRLAWPALSDHLYVHCQQESISQYIAIDYCIDTGHV